LSDRSCLVHDGKGTGIWVREQGRGTIVDCEICGNTGAGIGISSGGDPTVRSCRIHDGSDAGIYVLDARSRGAIKVCVIYGNNKTGIVFS
ncbi:right-handed parallel beta-helix repeat-containing protein, partial [Streptomyces sp. GbtcB7]|uniref:right-handed parallel beta-helix repeat-containing protein n=1 Tax=Streptomyces sp. GbtcB7 TaxID=2824752 RepID=UPI001C2F25EB